MPRLSTATLCSRPDCALPRRHRDGCDHTNNQTECPGCLPAQAADGLKLCRLHIERWHEDAHTAAHLHTELETQLRRRGRGEYTSGSRDQSNMPDIDVMETRHHIAYLLTGLVDLIVHERGFTPPNLRGFWRPAQQAHSEPAQLRLGDQGVGGHSDVGTSRRTATEVEVMAAYIAAHGEWFASRDDAGTHSKALHDATHGKVWALAYPSRARDYQEIGTCPLTVIVYAEDRSTSEETCGGRVFWYPEQSSLAYCDRCDQAETIEWWRRQIMGDPNAVIDTVAAAAWLSDRFRRPVLPSQIANWASRGKLPRMMQDEDKPLRDPRGRQLYRLDELEACAQKMFGAPPQARTRKGAAA